MYEPEISIVILTYNRSDLIDHRLTELGRLPLADERAEIVVLDNGSTDGTPLVLLSAKQNFDRRGILMRYERNEQNIGFARGFNLAVGLADSGEIVLLSNDVAVHGNFIPAVKEALSIRDRIVAREVVSRPAGWNVFGGEIFPWPNGYFLAMERSVWDQLGGFDGDFYPHDYEDVDLGYRALKGQIDLIELSALPVEHLVAQTVGYTPERYEHTCKMRALFAKKHGLQNYPERP